MDVNFAMVMEFSNGHSDLIVLKFLFYFNISQHQGPTYTPYEFQPKIPSHFGEMDLNARVVT